MRAPGKKTHRCVFAKFLPGLPRHLLLLSLFLVHLTGGNPAARTPSSRSRSVLTSLKVQRRNMLALAGAEFVYMSRLYDRMKELDSERSSDSPFTSFKPDETITGTYAIENSDDSPWLTFNTSRSLQAGDNITLAQVALARTRGYHSNTCLQLLATNSRRLTCRQNPLGIHNLMTFDVTSEVTTRSNENGFSVFLEYMHQAHIEKAMLVVFVNIDTEKLFEAESQSQSQEGGSYQQLGDVPDSASGADERATGRDRFKRQASGLGSVSGQRESNDRADNVDLDTGREDGAVADFQPDTSNAAVYGAGILGGDIGYQNGVLAEDLSRHREGPREMVLDTVQARYARYQSAKARSTSMGSGSQFPDFDLDMLANQLNQIEPRLKRDAEEASDGGADTHTSPDDECRVRPFVLDPWGDLLMSDVITPMYFNVNMCWGGCPSFLRRDANLTIFYSYLTSLFVHLHPDIAAGRRPPIPPLRCLPRTYEPISVMLVKSDGLVLKRWRNARVSECGCA